jgi:F-type H+-transporting ATPase subunit delta
MASSTRQALALAKEALSPSLAKADLKFAEEIFGMGAAIGSSVQLRNILSDPSGEKKAKAALTQAVFGKAVSKEALEFANTLAGYRWSKGGDLVAGFTQLGVFTIAGIVAKDKKLEELEAELFAFNQALASDRDLQTAFSSRQASVDAKLELIAALTNNKVSEAASILLRNAVINARNVRLAVMLEGFIKQVSAYASRLVANVTVASELSDSQLERLEASLTKTYGQEINLNVEIDPSILGGVKVQVSGEIIDGSVVARLNQAKMQLA